MEELAESLKKAVEEERNVEVEEMNREMSHLSGKERERKGRAVLSLRGKVIGEEFGYKLVKFGREKEIISEIATGDSVIVSLDNPLKNGFIGTVTEIGNKYLIVALDSISHHLFKKARIDLCVSDITFSRMIDILNDITAEGMRVLQYFSGERNPLKSEKKNISFFNKKLNEKQKEAVSYSMGTNDLFLIHGPFGTGKTKTLSEIILQEVKAGNRVLACAESNIAVDNLAQEVCGKVKAVRIGHPVRVSRKTKEMTLSSLIEKDKEYSSSLKLREMAEEIKKKQKEFLKPLPSSSRGLGKKEIMELSFLKKSKKGIPLNKIHSMARWISIEEKADSYYEGARAVEENITSRIVREAEVILTTNSSSALEMIGDDFDVAIIDEASQATLPGILIPLSKVTRFVLSGDHKQLPPTVMSEKSQILKNTLFESLMRRFPENSILLDTQYRMNERLMLFPSKEFYEGKIKASSSVRNISLSMMGVKEYSPSLVFIDTSNSDDCFEERKKDSFSIYNTFEAEKVKKIFLEFLKRGVSHEDIGIITPYEDQAELIKKICDADVHTVDGYQGQEREVMILSFVRSNDIGEVGFLGDMRRLNVSITRAKRKMVIVGNSKTLSKHETYRRLIDFIKIKKGFFCVDAKENLSLFL